MRLRIWKLRSLGLRVRLAVVYTLAFMAVLTLLGLVIRARFLQVSMDGAVSMLDDEAASIRKYVHADDKGLRWEFDTSINEEAFYVRRLRRVLQIADEHGHALETSASFTFIGVEQPEALRRSFEQPLPFVREVVGKNGERFVLRSDVFRIDGRNLLITLGRSMLDSDHLLRSFTVNYYFFVAALSIALAIFGWWLAGRGLRPLTDVARAAHAVNSSRLHSLIPMRGADDELDHLISAFNSMTERLEGSFNQMKHFSTDVSHELRTPLTSIRGQLEVALFTAKSESQLREAIIGSIDEVDHLSRLVNALLHLAAAESGQLVVNFDPIDFSQLVCDISGRFKEAADVQQLTLKCVCEPACLVQGDRIQLERLVTNLVGNALKYTPGGGAVTVQMTRGENDVVLSVQDTGRGISPGHLPHIFDRFYRVPAPTDDPTRGLGLGLSFVAWIVKAHKGQIDVKSELGKGSTFRVTLAAYHGPKPGPASAEKNS